MRNPYLVGIFWSLCACGVSALNDLSSKVSGAHLDGTNVLFFRFFFSLLFLLPFVLKNPQRFATKHFFVHGARGAIFALAMLPWCYGLIQLPLALVTTIGFTTPLFVTALSSLILKEKVGWQRVLAMVMGFIGVMISVGFSCAGMNGFVGLALLATFLFAVLDVVNKRLLVLQEGVGPMMLFSSLWATVLTAPLVVWNWHTPTCKEFGLLLLLGMGCNCILWCLLKASSSCELSALQPWRYTELLFSCGLSVLFLGQWPTLHVLAGAAIIIPATLYLSSRYELKRERTE